MLFGTGGVAQAVACFARAKTWIQTPALSIKKKKDKATKIKYGI
jgi:hypothetical protein